MDGHLQRMAPTFTESTGGLAAEPLTNILSKGGCRNVSVKPGSGTRVKTPVCSGAEKSRTPRLLANADSCPVFYFDVCNECSEKGAR